MANRTRTLRGQLAALMSIIAIVECVVLVLAVALSGAFTELDAEAVRFFENDSAERVSSLDGDVGRLVRHTVNSVTSFRAEAQKIADESGVALTEIYRDDELYSRLAMLSGDSLMELLSTNSISAAFFVLNRSNARKDDSDAHSAVYIRNAAPNATDTDRRHIQLEVGPSAVAQNASIAIGSHWELDMDMSAAQTDSFYTKPIEASLEYPRSELQRYGYWTPPAVILPGSQECIAYTLPVLDRNGQPFGVMGFELTVSYFTTEYFSSENLAYPSSFYVITAGSDSEINTEWMIPGNQRAKTALQPGEILPVRLLEPIGLYETRLSDDTDMYCSISELVMYSKNSPYVDDSWIFVGMVPESALTEVSTRIARTLLITMAITLGVAFIAIFLLSLFASRKIARLSQHVNEQAPGSEIEFPRIGLREVDDLTSAVERLHKRVNESLKVTSKMLELTQLPLGGFEISNDLDTVVLTEYVYSLLHLREDQPVTKEQWRKIYEELTASPVDGYSDVYRLDAQVLRALRYGGAAMPMATLLPGENAEPQDMYKYEDDEDDKLRWLRIIEAPTGNGTVGMILDATADIGECMRLAHELDYDALTHLYNRTAFKREAFKRIVQDPDRVGAMIFSDLDNLKHINDTYGHQMGDKLITTAADMFREFGDYGGIVARISGDEFAIFLYGFDSKRAVMEVISKLYRGFRNRYFTTPDGEKQYLSFSSGIAWYPEDSKDVADLLKLSDYAMYEAKHNEKGTLYEKGGKVIELHEESYMDNEQTQKNKDDLTKLIEDGLVRFRFQPIVDLKTCSIYGYEALMSPQVPGLSTPGEVISAARAMSMLGPLESMLVVKTIETAYENRDIIGDRKIFVNSIPGQRLSDDNWDYVRKHYSDVLQNVIIEVTEAENDDLEAMLMKLRRIRRMGLHVAIDDFGQGYSNEVRIIAMQPAIIKIDLELIRNLHADPVKQDLVRSLVTFAHSQDVKVVAEGVELEMELDTVERFGFDYAQGYLLGRPQFEFQSLSEPIVQKLESMRKDVEED